MSILVSLAPSRFVPANVSSRLVILTLCMLGACSKGPPREESPASRSSASVGKRLFLQGLDANGQSVPVRNVAGMQMESRQFPCAHCHGADGLGGQEGGVIAPELRWRYLAGPGLRPGWGPAERAAYDAASLARAVREGLDPDGRRLNPWMPRYAFSGRDVEALVTFLQQLDTAPAPGVTEDTVRLGMLLPRQGGARAGWERLFLRLQQLLVSVNEQGGVFGRQILLQGIESGPSPDSALAAAERALEGVLCFVANAGTGAVPAVSEGLDRRGMVVIGPLQVHAAAPSGQVERVFHVLPTFQQLGAAMATLASKRLPAASPGAPIALVIGGGERENAVARGFAAEARSLGMHFEEQAANDQYLGALVDRWRAHSTAVLALATGPSTSARLLLEVANRHFTPTVIASSELSGPGLDAPLQRHVITPAGGELEPPSRRESRAAWAEAAALAEAQALEQAALVALDVALEALKRAGHELSRARLLSALLTLQSYRSWASTPLRFGPRDRAGAAQVSSFAFDPSGTLQGRGLVALD